MSSQDHNLYIQCSTIVLVATYQFSLQQVQQFLRRRFLKGFTIYGHGGHLGHETWFIYNHIDFPFLQMFPIKFDFDWPKGLRENL